MPTASTAAKEEKSCWQSSADTVRVRVRARVRVRVRVMVRVRVRIRARVRARVRVRVIGLARRSASRRE